MSWQAASFVLLAVALVGGFAWYERAHPSAKVLALVGTLAALAAIGRIAFAPLPNIKPTTDIVLLSGFALGGAPGFAVGAVAALVSNVVFGQGPWTPWQMVAWGGVGVGGAVLARMTGGHLGRIPLAIACGVAGLAFGAFMNIGSWVNFTGGETSGSLAVLYVRAIPFDLAHAIGNVVFCLAFGPYLVNALQRLAQRFEVRWEAAVPAAAVLGALVLVSAVPSAQAATPAEYLVKVQNGDGGFGGGPGQGSTQLHTGWAALGLAAAGRNPADVSRGGQSIVDYVRRGAGGLDDTGELERTILVLRASGLNPRDFAGRNLVAELRRRQRSDGSINRQVSMTAFGILALKASREPSGKAGAWLARQQNPDGGFGFQRRGTASDIDNTGSAIQALVAAGRRSSATVRRAVTFLRRQQQPSGGWPLNLRGAANAQSTAWALQGLFAARAGGTGKGLRYLRTLQSADGSVNYSRTSRQTPIWVTGQALTALARKPFPLGPTARAARDARAPARTSAGNADRPAEKARSARKVRKKAADSPMGPLATGTVKLMAPVVVLAHRSGAALGLVLGPIR